MQLPACANCLGSGGFNSAAEHAVTSIHRPFSLCGSETQAAIRHIRNLAQENHERALPELQKSSFAFAGHNSLRVFGPSRLEKSQWNRGVLNLGYTDTELFMALSWVRELAPLIVHINLDKALGVVLAKGHD